jgi:hypothetical protein
MADKTAVAEVVLLRAARILSVMSKALKAERRALHEGVDDLAPVAPDRIVQIVLCQLHKVTVTMEGVNDPALGADVIGQVLKFPLGTSVFGVVASFAFGAEKRSHAKPDVSQSFAVMANARSFQVATEILPVAAVDGVMAVADVAGVEDPIRMVTRFRRTEGAGVVFLGANQASNGPIVEVPVGVPYGVKWKSRDRRQRSRTV